MKTILTTDFTKASNHAIDYSMQLLSNFKGKEVNYTLVHAFRPMAPYVEMSSIPVLENVAWKAELKKDLINLQKKLKEKYAIDAEPQLKRGGVFEVIQSLEKEKPDLVVMATRQKSFFERITFGSNTLQVAENADTPVLEVPKEAKIKKPRKVAFATDLKPLEIPYKSLKLMKEIIQTHHASLEVIHVYKDEADKKEKDKLKDSFIHRYVEEIDHKHVSLFNDNVYDGIAEYIEKDKPDMMVIISRDRNFIQKIFQESITEKMTYHTEIPLLVLN